jgi:hypothetical protein
MRFYLGCLVLFAIVIMISILTTRQKTTTTLDKLDDIEDILTDDLDDKFDLYDSIYEFMTKQNKYLQRIN